ncbi:MAG: AraC family transcriptional regulator [bacterium]
MKNINKLFSPIQGLARFVDYPALYQEIKPAKHLQEHIICYWVSPYEQEINKGILSDIKKDKIVPDACIDIIFHIDRETRDYYSLLVGMMQSPLVAIHEFNKIQTFGIRFYPGGLYPLLRDDLSIITDKAIVLADIMGFIDKEIGEKIASADSIYSMLNIANNYFSRLLEGNKVENHNLKNILHNIYISSGNIDIKQLSSVVDLSSRQVRRIFNNWVGLTPKAFCRVIRFQNTLKFLKSSGSKSIVDTAIDNGFFDQSHLINDFKDFTGTTPGELIAR